MSDSVTDAFEVASNGGLQNDVNTSIDDVLTAAFGETIEPTNTDAQYGEEKSPIQQKYVFDVVGPDLVKDCRYNGYSLLGSKGSVDEVLLHVDHN